jgi:hypothetical protein
MRKIKAMLGAMLLVNLAIYMMVGFLGLPDTQEVHIWTTITAVSVIAGVCWILSGVLADFDERHTERRRR